MAKRRRFDPYKTFKFRITFATVTAAIVGFAVAKRLMPKTSARKRQPNDYVSDIPATGRPIDAVGTTVAAGRAAAKSKARGASRHGATGTRRTRTAKPKRR